MISATLIGLAIFPLFIWSSALYVHGFDDFTAALYAFGWFLLAAVAAGSDFMSGHYLSVYGGFLIVLAIAVIGYKWAMLCNVIDKHSMEFTAIYIGAVCGVFVNSEREALDAAEKNDVSGSISRLLQRGDFSGAYTMAKLPSDIRFGVMNSGRKECDGVISPVYGIIGRIGVAYRRSRYVHRRLYDASIDEAIVPPIKNEVVRSFIHSKLQATGVKDEFPVFLPQGNQISAT